MRNTTHEVIGLSLGLVAGRVARLDWLETAGLVGAALYGSRLPDVDRLGSRIHRRSRFERRSLSLRAAGTVARAPMLLVGLIAAHRGVSHSLVAAALNALLTAALLSPLGSHVGELVGLGLALGYAAHLAADACTPSGVRPFLPVSRRRVWLLPRDARIPTGSLRELTVAGPIVALAAALLLG